MRFDDRKGDEQMFFHAERDHETWVGNDALMNIGAQRHLRVDGSEFVLTGGSRNDTVEGAITQRAGGDVSNVTLGSHGQFVGAAYTLDTGAAATVHAGTTVVIEAGTSIALRAGVAWIVIGPETIEMSSMPIPLVPGPPVAPLSVPPPAPIAPRDADDGNNHIVS
jgi:type VI secretion system secreted protein VgrG